MFFLFPIPVQMFFLFLNKFDCSLKKLVEVQSCKVKRWKTETLQDIKKTYFSVFNLVFVVKWELANLPVYRQSANQTPVLMNQDLLQLYGNALENSGLNLFIV